MLSATRCRVDTHLHDLVRDPDLLGGSALTSKAGSILTSVAGRLAGIDPLEYLRDVLPRMARKVRLLDLSELLPHHWKQRRDAVAAFCAALARWGRGD